MRAAVIVIALLAAEARAETLSEVRAHIDAGAAAHAKGDYATALVELTAAYDLDPQPDLLYAIGQVHSKLGDCAAATASFEAFRATVTDAETREVVQQAIEHCEPKVVARAPTAVEPSPFYTDVAGDLLVGSGVVAGVIGLVLYTQARGQLDDAERAPSLLAYQAAVDSARTGRALAIAFGIGGALLVGGGVVRFAMREDGGVVSVGGTF